MVLYVTVAAKPPREAERLRFQIRFEVLRLVGFAECVQLTEEEREIAARVVLHPKPEGGRDGTREISLAVGDS